MHFYDEDLARIHDLGFTAFADAAAPAIITILEDNHLPSGHVLDLGCGSGVLSRHLLDAGFDVTGIDASPSMIDLARTRAPGATLINASFHDTDLPPCRAAISVGECFNYLDAAPDDPASLQSLFHRIHAALDPGGLLIFDVALPGRAGFATRLTNRVAQDWAVLSESTEEGATLTRRITTFTRDHTGAFRRTDETHHLRLTPPDDILHMLASAGFTARILPAYPGMTFPNAYAAFHARKPH
jgi:SAM-dependent methyltransferase